MVRAGGERMSGAWRKGGESEDAGRSDNRAYVSRFLSGHKTRLSLTPPELSLGMRRGSRPERPGQAPGLFFGALIVGHS